MTVAQKGSKVKVEYVGTLEDGTVFDRSEEGKPLEFVIGDSNVIPEFEQAIEGMEVGQNKKIEIDAEHAYGKRDESLIRKIPKNLLPDNVKPEKGMSLNLYLPNGSSVAASIVEMTENEISVDLNHPLADKDLIFNVKLVGIE